MPHDGLRFGKRARGKLSKEGKVITRTKTTIVATSMLLEPDGKIKQPRLDVKSEEIEQEVKKEEPTPENNDVKTDSKE